VSPWEYFFHSPLALSIVMKETTYNFVTKNSIERKTNVFGRRIYVNSAAREKELVNNPEISEYCMIVVIRELRFVCDPLLFRR